MHLSIIFIVIGGYLLYLAYKKDRDKFFFVKDNLFKDIFIVTNDFVYKDFSKPCFQRKAENFYFNISINSDVPDFLHDNLKIKYSLYFVIFYKNKISLNLIKDKKIIICVKYKNNKTLEFFFDNNIYLMIKSILDIITKINYKNIKDINLFPLNEVYFDKKCEKCVSLDCKKN